MPKKKQNNTRVKKELKDISQWNDHRLFDWTCLRGVSSKASSSSCSLSQSHWAFLFLFLHSQLCLRLVLVPSATSSGPWAGDWNLLPKLPISVFFKERHKKQPKPLSEITSQLFWCCNMALLINVLILQGCGTATLTVDLPVFNELTAEAHIHSDSFNLYALLHSKVLKYLVYNNIHHTNKGHLVRQITQIIDYRCLMLLLIGWLTISAHTFFITLHYNLTTQLYKPIMHFIWSH